MQQFSLKGGLKKFAPKSNAFESADDEESQLASPSQKPLDYLQIKVDMEKSSRPDLDTGPELTEKEERAKALKRREDAIQSKPAGPMAISSTVNLKQAGLVVLSEKSSKEKSESKHIARMVETAQVNEKFKNLLKMKTAQRELSQAESELGARPQEFLTASYLKQREENLRLERELEAGESQRKKRDVSNLFREMLGSGHYSRTQFVDPSTATEPSRGGATDLLQRISQGDDIHELDPLFAEKVLRRVVPEDAKEVSQALEQQAREEALRIVNQLDKLAQDTEQIERDETILSAKERYMLRKKQRIHNSSSSQ